MSENSFAASQRALVTAGAFLTVVACMTSIAPAHGQSPPAPGTWSMKAPLPAPRAEVSAVALDGKLHALGGSVNGGTVRGAVMFGQP